METKIITAQEFLYHCWAGLALAGKDEDGELEWIGEHKNRTALMWLEDGVYESHQDKGESAIKEYLYNLN